MADYGSSAVQNRVRPGGSLGSNQYWYSVDKKTGTITVYNHSKVKQSDNTFLTTNTSIGTIPQQGTFIPNGNATSSEKTYYKSKDNLGSSRQNALSVVQREWDKKTRPTPHNLIYGEGGGNAPFDPPGSGTPNTSLKNVGTAALQGGLNALAGGGGLGDIVEGALGGVAGSLFGNRSSRSFGALVYPVSMRQSDQDFIKITELEYKPSGTTNKTLAGVNSRPSAFNGRKRMGTIILPIPGGISDTNAVSWGQDKLDPAQAALANLALAGIEGADPMGGMIGELEGLVETAGKSNKEIKDAIAKTVAGQASGAGAQLLTRTTGKIMNPNMELLFKDPSLRPFNFTWKLSPRSQDEAKTVVQIINLFKKAMAPRKSPGSLFLLSPHTFILEYYHRGQPHLFLNKFKECALTSFTTSYTPDGNYATFEDGVMTSYSITAAFQELEPIFANDYSNTNEIGY